MMRIFHFAARWMMLFKPMRSSSTIVSVVRAIDRLNTGWGLVPRFTLLSLIIIVTGMGVIGWRAGEQIKAGVLKDVTASTALYMDSFIAPHVQELGTSTHISGKHTSMLDNLFSESNLGERTVTVKIWNSDHRIVYSNNPALMGRTFPDTTDLVEAWQGKVTGEISSLEEAENVEERAANFDDLLEIYSPVRRNDTNNIIAVAEFYQKVDTLNAATFAAQTKSWLVVGSTMAVMYFLLVGFIRLAGRRIDQQEKELKDQISDLTKLLAQNRELTNRVRIAAANTTSLNESFLRRTSAELHDGPLQGISLALLRLDKAIDQNESCRLSRLDSNCNASLLLIQASLRTALKGVRSIASEYGLPPLDRMTLAEVISKVVRMHEQHTGTSVELYTESIPNQVDPSLKITTYRFIQEALNNAYLHAGAQEQKVRVACNRNQMQIEVSDQGPGFVLTMPDSLEDQAGLAVMRGRVESLGGFFTIDSKIDEGTRVTALLPLSQSLRETIYG